MLLKLCDPAPEHHEINAYDLGTILISTQRLFGTIGSFELNRKDTDFYEIKKQVLRIPRFERQSIIQVRLKEIKHGSLNLDLGIGVAYEIYRYLEENPLIASIIMSVLANFFSSAALIIGNKSTSPLGEYRGYLGELNLFSRTGKLRNTFDDTVQELAIPNNRICEKMAKYLNKEIFIIAQVEITRDVETIKLRTKYIVHDFKSLDQFFDKFNCYQYNI